MAADEVDHVQPLKDAPERRLDPTNIQSLCTPCHQAKSATENGSQVIRTYMEDEFSD